MSHPTPGPDQERTRRAFLGGVARKAAYVAPAVLAMSTHRADAGGISCKPLGSPCVADLECCSLNCRFNMGTGTCKM